MERLGTQYSRIEFFSYEISDPEPVFSQAHFDLAAVEVEDNTSDVAVDLEQVVAIEGAIEFFGVRNLSERPVYLRSSLGRASLSAVCLIWWTVRGETVAGTFKGGTAPELAPGS